MITILIDKLTLAMIVEKITNILLFIRYLYLLPFHIWEIIILFTAGIGYLINKLMKKVCQNKGKVIFFVFIFIIFFYTLWSGIPVLYDILKASAITYLQKGSEAALDVEVRNLFWSFTAAICNRIALTRAAYSFVTVIC